MAPKVEGSSPSFYPMSTLFFYNFFSYNVRAAAAPLFTFLGKISTFYFDFFAKNNLLWQEGLYLDFIQKKIVDSWIKKSLISSSYIFSEKIVFDVIVKFFLINIINPFHKFSVYEVNSISSLLFITLFFFTIFYFFYFFNYVYLLLF